MFSVGFLKPIHLVMTINMLSEEWFGAPLRPSRKVFNACRATPTLRAIRSAHVEEANLAKETFLTRIDIGFILCFPHFPLLGVKMGTYITLNFSR